MPIALLIKPTKDQQLPCTIETMMIGPFNWNSATDFRPNPVEIGQSQRKEIRKVIVEIIFSERYY
jgi:hypothetical protein